jgi:hypothetical protein
LAAARTTGPNTLLSPPSGWPAPEPPLPPTFPSAVLLSAAPDFAVLSVDTVPASPREGDLFSARVVVTNVGASAGSPGAVAVWALNNSVPAGTVFPCNAATPGGVYNSSATATIAPGVSATVVVDGLRMGLPGTPWSADAGTPSAGAGTKRLLAFVDPACAGDEVRACVGDLRETLRGARGADSGPRGSLGGLKRPASRCRPIGTGPALAPRRAPLPRSRPPPSPKQSNRANNQLVSTYTQAGIPDLVVAPPGAPNIALNPEKTILGNAIDVVFNVTNRGDGPSTATAVVHLWLEWSATGPPAACYANGTAPARPPLPSGGVGQVGPLAAGASTSAPVYLSLTPSGQTLGAKRLYVLLDATCLVDEGAMEANNAGEPGWPRARGGRLPRARVGATRARARQHSWPPSGAHARAPASRSDFARASPLPCRRGDGRAPVAPRRPRQRERPRPWPPRYASPQRRSTTPSRRAAEPSALLVTRPEAARAT